MIHGTFLNPLGMGLEASWQSPYATGNPGGLTSKIAVEEIPDPKGEQNRQISQCLYQGTTSTSAQVGRRIHR